MTSVALRRAVGALPSVGISLLPKLMCPACWPAYAGIVSALGLSFLISAKYLLLLTALFLSITLLTLGFKADRRNGYGPLWIGLLASGTILTGKFYLNVSQLTYAGLGLLISASVWNSWPRRAAKAPFCSACVPAEVGSSVRNAQGRNYMSHKIEVFSAGCKVCSDTIDTITKFAGAEHQIVVHDMQREEVATRAAQHGVRSVPAVLIDGGLAGCCANKGIDESVLREALV